MIERTSGMGRLILWPAAITLVVELVRLAGELNQWSPLYFGRAAGGGFALVGIVWLVPVFGIYFGWRLAQVGRGGSAGRILGFSGLALLVLLVGAVLAEMVAGNEVLSIVIIGAIAIISIVVTRLGSTDLFALLLAYGFAVRIPLVVIYFLAFALGWDTHYSAVSPGFPFTGWFTQWLVLGVVPQLTFWIAFTLVFGSLFGGLTLLVVGRRHRRPA